MAKQLNLSKEPREMIQIRQVINSLRYPSEHYWTQISSILNSVSEKVSFCADINDTVFHCFPQKITFWGPVTTMPLNGFFQYTFSCKVQSVLIICRFCICEFTYLLTFICDPQINSCSILWSFKDTHEKDENWCHLRLDEVTALPPYSMYYKQVFFSRSI